MKLSEAIKEGAKKTKPAFGTFYGRNSNNMELGPPLQMFTSGTASTAAITGFYASSIGVQIFGTDMGLAVGSAVSYSGGWVDPIETEFLSLKLYKPVTIAPICSITHITNHVNAVITIWNGNEILIKLQPFHSFKSDIPIILKAGAKLKVTCSFLKSLNKFKLTAATIGLSYL